MKRGHDLSGIMKFATGPAWAEHLRGALDDHLGDAMEEFEFEADELADIVGDHWAGVLWGCAFEDLLTREVEPDGRNLVEDYLKRRGWNEAGPNKLYMRVLRSSVMSLYEVSEVEPGQGFLVRDLIRGGDLQPDPLVGTGDERDADVVGHEQSFQFCSRHPRYERSFGLRIRLWRPYLPLI